MSSTEGRRPPPLPPRQPSSMRSSSPDAPPPYEDVINSTTRDPRTSSQQSLGPPAEEDRHGRRKLLLVYIHGFMGNESSFRSFPAHVHQLLRALLSETHVIHTKIYPRYRSRRHISVARDDFSKWLEPHESQQTDVVLLGHSMGGLISAEVALVQPPRPANRALKHHILGTINFDVPFLGMHPGIIRSGLSSIFMPSEETHQDHYADAESAASNGLSPGSPAQSPSPPSGERPDTLFAPGQEDPNFNPSFHNDVILPVRKGWSNAIHFLNKHSKDLRTATKQLVSSHMEFGGAMANYTELKARYSKVRILEEKNGDLRRSAFPGLNDIPRVRFINYYTASTGRPKKAGSPVPLPTESQASASSLQLPDPVESSHSRQSSRSTNIRTPSPSITISEHTEDGVVEKRPIPDEVSSSVGGDWERAVENLSAVVDRTKPADIDTQPPGGPPMTASPPPDYASRDIVSPTESTSTLQLLPELPPAPTMPDVSNVTDSKTLKSIMQEHTQALRDYEKAIQAREKIIRKNNRVEEKLERRSKRAVEKLNRKENKHNEEQARTLEKFARAQQRAESKKERFESRMAALEQKGKERELTHSEREELRLEKERLRMEREGRRMRGEPEPEEIVAGPAPPETNETGSDAILTPPSSPEVGPVQESVGLPAATEERSKSPVKDEKPKKPPKDRKFCVLPPKDSSGVRDPCWVRVYMEGVDEVGAHCGLFFVDERYERMVGDVAERIEGWVREEGDGRVARSWSDLGERREKN